MVRIGDRIKLIETKDRYTDLINNEYIGTVDDLVYVNIDGGFIQIWVNFDNGSYFAIVPETGDQYEILSTSRAYHKCVICHEEEKCKEAECDFRDNMSCHGYCYPTLTKEGKQMYDIFIEKLADLRLKEKEQK